MAERGVVLTGFMGAGKTSVATELAALWGCPWRDLDDFITERAGRAVPDIIDQDGEAYFRDLETENLRALLAEGPARVIALGGGAWGVARNRRILLAHNYLTVWLDAPFAVCWERIAGTARPLARDPAQARKLYEQRQEFYRQAEIRIDAARYPPKELAIQVSALVKNGDNRRENRDTRQELLPKTTTK